MKLASLAINLQYHSPLYPTIIPLLLMFYQFHHPLPHLMLMVKIYLRFLVVDNLILFIHFIISPVLFITQLSSSVPAQFDFFYLFSLSSYLAILIILWCCLNTLQYVYRYSAFDCWSIESFTSNLQLFILFFHWLIVLFVMRLHIFISMVTLVSWTILITHLICS